ncbi:hypothetical protein PQQ99_37085 [Paraburkholderia sediminicola]|uniref:hypothetical protein n=1 Tax=Paraburkholderia sediminicola TaxID=458836 RepID=UPI0038B87098
MSSDISKMGEKVKAGEAFEPIEYNGIRVEFRPTNWTNVEDVYGYSKLDDAAAEGAHTRKLAADEIQSKVTKSKAAAATPPSNADQGHGQ